MEETAILNTAISWLKENKAWLFSGIGVLILSGLVRLLFRRKSAASSQKLESGDNSINIQAGGNVHTNIPSSDKK